MLSLLWKASSEGNLPAVQDLLKNATTVDIEIKDHTGATPLIEAVKNGHIEVVRALLDRGADPTNASSQGRPDSYTSDPAILELLNSAQNKTAVGTIPTHEVVFPNGTDATHEKPYGYSHQTPVMPYPYYPSLNPIPPPAEGAPYYPPPPLSQNGEGSPGGANNNLPPPEVARFIPCRYFPACRYGTSCIFAHPPAPYYPGPVPPPSQYAGPYDPINVQSYPPGYYPPPSFQPPSNQSHMATVMAHSNHTHSPSEVAMPPPPPTFNTNGVPPAPYGAVSPSTYAPPHPTHPSVPMPISPLSSLPQVPLSNQSSSNVYNTIPAPLPTFVQHDAPLQYPASQTLHANLGNPEVDSDAGLPINPQADSTSPNHGHRDGSGHQRRGSARRTSFGGRKPPCLFFPAGRCKNGDDCRFPHVLSDASGTHQQYFSGRGGRTRHPSGNGFAAINEKLASMAIRDVSSTNRDDNSRSPPDSVPRSRHPHGQKNFQANGFRHEKKQAQTAKQRIPHADEFPALSGTVTPPSRNGVNGFSNGSGPTAAQVLQAPPPQRRETSKDSTPRVATPDSATAEVHKAEPNGIIMNGVSHDHTIPKLPVSFATAAGAEMPKEITLSA